MILILLNPRITFSPVAEKYILNPIIFSTPFLKSYQPISLKRTPSPCYCFWGQQGGGGSLGYGLIIFGPLLKSNNISPLRRFINLIFLYPTLLKSIHTCQIRDLSSGFMKRWSLRKLLIRNLRLNSLCAATN